MSSPAVSPNPSPLIFLHNLLRDQFDLSTWLILGACLQIILNLIPFVRTSYAQYVAFAFLGLKLINTLLMTYDLKPNVYMARVLPYKFTALYPTTQASTESATIVKGEGSGRTAILLLGFRINHPLGILAPGAQDMVNYFQSMMKDLKANAPANGFMGATNYLDAGQRTTSSTIMTNFYFRSAADVHNFAHGPVHRKGWDWWSKFVKTNRHLAIMHEVYEAPSGKWENIYVNFEPMGFAATRHKVLGEDGKEEWRSPIVDAGKGNYRTHKGRMGQGDGGDNDELY